MARIMIVDDAPDACEALAGLLEKDGHEVSCHIDSVEAFAQIIRDPPDLLILDLFMPRMDGAQLLQALRSYLRLQSLPVIVWTGLSEDSQLVDRARACQVRAIIIKGRSSFEDMEHVVQQAVRGQPDN